MDLTITPLKRPRQCFRPRLRNESQLNAKENSVSSSTENSCNLRKLVKENPGVSPILKVISPNQATSKTEVPIDSASVNVKRKLCLTTVSDSQKRSNQKAQILKLDNLPNGPWTKQLKYLPKYFNLESIFDYFNKNKATKHLEDGNRMVKSKKVGQVLLCATPVTLPRSLFVKCVIISSYSSKEYVVQIELNIGSGAVLNGYCQCPCGTGGVCKHASALLFYLWDCKLEKQIYIKDTRSCTEGPRQWGNVSQRTSKLVTKDFSDLQFVRHKLVHRLRDKPLKQQCCKNRTYSSLPKLTEAETIDDDIKLRQRFEKFSKKSMEKRRMLKMIITENDCKPTTTTLKSALLSEKPNTDLSIPRPEIPFPDLLPSIDFVFPLNCLITLEHAKELESLTREQADPRSKNCQLWKSEREIRITASKFGEVIKRKKEVTAKYIETLKKGADLSSNPYVQEGLNNETKAIEMYEEVKNREVVTFKVGFCVNPSVPILGASPDRICFDKTCHEYGLIEIKTLSKAKKEHWTIKEAILNKAAPCLKLEKSGEISLKENHNYFYQIQGQLGVTGYKWCDFFIVTENDSFCQRIYLDKNLFNTTIVPKLCDFYIKYFK